MFQVLYIQAFVLVFLLGKFMRKVFFGQLRAAEMEVNICPYFLPFFIFYAAFWHHFVLFLCGHLLHLQHLIERSWYAVTETCLAFTVFRDDFSPRFVALFTLLLFLKCFHWLAEDRVDFVSDDRNSSVLSTEYILHYILMHWRKGKQGGKQMVCGQGGVRHGKHSSVSTLLLITLSKTKCEESATTM